MPVSKAARGTVFAIGGREDRKGESTVLDRFVAICGGGDARILVISAASSDPAQKVVEYDAVFRKKGARDVEFAQPVDRVEADHPKLLVSLERATGVFFMGGNQLKLVSELGGTRLLDRLRSLHAEGLHVGGTSAGASALGAVMIARGKARSAARLSSLRMTSAFGLLPNLVLDQHFRERDRFGRLLAAVLCNPACVGLGLDEDTAFELDGNDRLTVLGRGTLTIVDGSQLEMSNIGRVPEDEPAAFVGMRLHVLSDGWSYDLVDGSVERPSAAAAGDTDPSAKSLSSGGDEV